MLSDDIEPIGNVCVQFWYHMHGSDTGNLSIYVKTNQSETLVWRLSGDQGNRWRFGQTALNSPSLYKVKSLERYAHFGMGNNVNIFLRLMFPYLLAGAHDPEPPSSILTLGVNPGPLVIIFRAPRGSQIPALFYNAQSERSYV